MINEEERLNSLYSYAVLDTAPEIDFDNIVQLASQICNTPVSLITLVDQDRQWFKARRGIGLAETSRKISFCTYAIQQQEIMMVPDATKDERFAQNPLVTGDMQVRFYAGAQLMTPDGQALGTLCVLDQQPRELSPEQLFALKTLSQQVVVQLELRVKVRQLDALLNTKSKILSIISHDVKGPVRNIKHLLNLFAAEQVTYEDMKRLAAELIKSLDKADLLLSDLLNWFTALSETGEHHFTSIKLSQLLEELLVENEELFKRKGNRVLTNISDDAAVAGDAHMLKFVFRNLLLNANKFTHNGTISISIQTEGKYGVVAIKDTGVGIAPARLETLFKREKNKSTPGTAKEKGHGLGLLLSQDFIAKHHGQLKVFSEEGGGTEVQVLLPVTMAKRNN